MSTEAQILAWRSNNEKRKQSGYFRDYFQKHKKARKARRNAASRRWRAENLERAKETLKAWRFRNRKHIRNYENQYRQRRRLEGLHL